LTVQENPADPTGPNTCTHGLGSPYSGFSGGAGSGVPRKPIGGTHGLAKGAPDLRARYGFPRPVLYDSMLSMRGGYLIPGLLFGPAPAGAEPAPWSGRLPQPPPEEFAGPYEGELTINRVPLAEMGEHCRKLPRVLGCAHSERYFHSYCTVYIPNDVPERLEAAILEHELGHCNGWRHPHEGKAAADARESPWPGYDTIREAAIRWAKQNPICAIEKNPACP
jgi:hypothetical protein